MDVPPWREAVDVVNVNRVGIRSISVELAASLRVCSSFISISSGAEE